MTSIPKVTTKRKGSTDPRYRNGIFTNTRAQREDRARLEQEQYLANHPRTNGWLFAGECKLTGFPVFNLEVNQGVHLRRSETGRWWVVFMPDGEQFPFVESVAEFTPKIIGKLDEPEVMTAAEVEARQAQWEASHPADDYGLEGRG